MMESNKDDAINCIRLAKKEESDGNVDRAIHFIKKSLRLYATSEAQELLIKLEERKKDVPTDNLNQNTSSSHREAATPHETSQEESDPQKLQEIDKILKCRSLYDILSVSKDATTAEIKKQYRNLSLKFHPDKCKVPRSTEAFKSISRAFTILSDDHKRKRYDVSGDETDQNGMTSGMHSHYFAEEMDPFDLFASMFSGEMEQLFTQNGRTYRIHSSRPRQRGGGFTYMNRRREGREAAPHQNITSLLIVLLPLMIFIIFPIFNSVIDSLYIEYYLEPRASHPIQRRLYNSDKFYYYVKSDFTQHYKTKEEIARFEYKVASDLLHVYSETCHREEYDKRLRINSARFFGKQEDIKKAQNLITPSCANFRLLSNLRSNHQMN